MLALLCCTVPPYTLLLFFFPESISWLLWPSSAEGPAPPLCILPPPIKSVGFRIVAIIFFVDWIEWFELLCFIVFLNSVFIMLLLAPTWIVPEGCKAANMPLTPLLPACPGAGFYFLTVKQKASEQREKSITCVVGSVVAQLHLARVSSDRVV